MNQKYKPGEPFKTAEAAAQWMISGEPWFRVQADLPNSLWAGPYRGFPQFSGNGDFAPAIPVGDEPEETCRACNGTRMRNERLGLHCPECAGPFDIVKEEPHPTLGMTPTEQRRVLALLAKTRDAFNAYRAKPAPLLGEVDAFLAKHCYRGQQ